MGVRYTSDQIKNLGIMEVNGTFKVPSRKTAKVKPNAKIKNAVKVEENGVQFDSRLEKYLYDALTNAKIEFEFQKTYTIQLGFKYLGEAIRPIKIVVDFKLKNKNIIVDTKGWATPISKLKYKMLKHHLIGLNDEPQIFMPSTPKECDFLVSQLVNGKY